MSSKSIVTIEQSAKQSVESAAARILRAALAIKAAGEAAARQGEHDRQAFLALRGQLEERKGAVRELVLTVNKALEEARTLRLSVEYIESGLVVPGDHVTEGEALLAEARQGLAVIDDRIESLRHEVSVARSDVTRISQEMDVLNASPVVAALLMAETRRELERAAHEEERHQALRDARRAPSAIGRFVGLVEIQERFGGTELAGEIESVAGGVMGDARSASRRSPEEAVSGLASLAVVHGKLPEGSTLRQQVFGLFATIASTQHLFVSRRGFPLAAAEVSDGHAIVVASGGGKGVEIGALADARAFRASDPRERVPRPVDPRLAPLADTFRRSACSEQSGRPAGAELRSDEPEQPPVEVEPAVPRMVTRLSPSDGKSADEEPPATLGQEALEEAAKALAEHFAPAMRSVTKERSEPAADTSSRRKPPFEGKSAAALRSIAQQRIDERARELGRCLSEVPHAVDATDAAVALAGWEAAEMAGVVARGLELAGSRLLDLAILLQAATEIKPDWQPAPASKAEEAPTVASTGRKRARRALGAAAEMEEAVAA